MNCFMGYNPLVAKEVKITTWIKEFDGESPVYPSFPSDGDCFVVFATDEDALTHNALSKKTYTNGDWADAESGGGGGGGDYPTFTLTFEDMAFVGGTCDMTYAECKALCTEEYANTYPCICIYYNDGAKVQEGYDCIWFISDEDGISFATSFIYNSDGTIAYNGK